MKRFYKEIFFAIVGIVFGSMLISIVFNPKEFSYGNWLLTEKYHQLEDQSDVNTLFLGSSIVYRSVNCEQLDIASKEIQLNSFNMGAPGCTNIEQYYIYEKILEETDLKFKYAFLDLNRLRLTNEENLFTLRTIYWLNLENVQFYIKQLYEEEHITNVKYYQVGSVLLNYAYKILSLKDFRNLVIDDKDDFSKPLPNMKNGFLALEDEVTDSITNASLQVRRNRLIKNPNFLLERVEEVKNAYNKDSYKTYISQSHLDKMRTLIKLSEAKGIKLLFIIYPRLGFYEQSKVSESYCELLALKEQLPKHIIDLGNPVEYPQLYTIDNSFDYIHLNKKGATILTNELSRKLATF